VCWLILGERRNRGRRQMSIVLVSDMNLKFGGCLFIFEVFRSVPDSKNRKFFDKFSPLPKCKEDLGLSLLPR
jgi:hypothetical protein